MKKKLIAAGAASFAVAAMPVVGVLAISYPSTSVTDDITIGVNAGCTMTRDVAYDASEHPEGYVQAGDGQNTPYTLTNAVVLGNTAPGTTKTGNGQEITVTCTGESTLNDTTKTWLLKAVGSSDVSGTGVTNTASASTNSLIKWDSKTTVDKIDSGYAGGLDGDTSEWAFKITAGNGSGNTSNFTPASVTEHGTYASDYQIVPATEATIATMSYAANANVYKFTPNYKVSVSDTQASGTYLGHVTYTIVANPAG